MRPYRVPALVRVIYRHIWQPKSQYQERLAFYRLELLESSQLRSSFQVCSTTHAGDWNGGRLLPDVPHRVGLFSPWSTSFINDGLLASQVQEVSECFHAISRNLLKTPSAVSSDLLELPLGYYVAKM
jgi:hypothetical protein